MVDNNKGDPSSVAGFARDLGKGLVDDAKRASRNGLLFGGILAAVFGTVGFFLFGLQGLLYAAGAGFVIGFVLAFIGPALFC